jgi:transglutaminase-like putative cysteine protease
MIHPSERQSKGTSVGASLALCLLAICTTFIFQQVVVGNRLFSYLIPTIICAHLLLWLGRKLKVPMLISSAIAAVASLGLVTYRIYGFPFSHIHELRVDLHLASDQVINATPPIVAYHGVIVVICATFVVAAIFSDWFAFRRNLLFEVVVPYFAIFAFIAIIGESESVWFATAAFLLGTLLFSIFQVVNMRVNTVSTDASTKAKAAYLRIGFGIIATVVFCVPLLTQLLPGYEKAGLVHINDNFGSSQDDSPIPSANGSTDISHSISLKRQLVKQSNTEFFSVKSSHRTYWRELVLDDFKNGVWTTHSGPYSFQPPAPAGNAFDSTITIKSLATKYLPGPFPAVSTNAPAKIDPATGIIFTKSAIAQNSSYTVVGVNRNFTPEQLFGADPNIPSAVRAVDLNTNSVTPRAAALAHQITQSSRSSYDKALAIETYLRSNYQYDLNSAAPTNTNSLDQFLFKTKRGYCQQFSGAYAAMARSVGVPARVAIGYTPGELGTDGLYHVLGLHAHAWPEVYLGQYGWVPFEPTPTRGIPNATSYTNVAEAQANPNNPQTATTQTTFASATTNTTTSPTTFANNSSQKDGRRHLIVFVGLGILAAILIAFGFLLARRNKNTLATPDQCWRNVEHALAKHKLYRYEGETRMRFSKRASQNLENQDPHSEIPFVLVEFARRVDEVTFAAHSEVRNLRRDSIVISSAISHKKLAGQKTGRG